jgi:hypothetical protein
MPLIVLPDTFAPLLPPFQSCFHVQNYRTFGSLVPGWVQCRERHAITAVVVAAGAVRDRHV